MRRTYIIVFIFLITVLQTGPLQAQGLKKLEKAFTQLNRAAMQAKRPDIRLSVARLDHALLLDSPANKRPHSSAFLFQTTYRGKPEIWAVTAGHVAQMNEPLLLTFYNGKKEIAVNGKLVQQGPALLSDAALIKLETPLPDELQPFILAQELDPQEKLTTWGYASNKLYHIDDLTFEKDNTRFIRTDFPVTQHKRSGLCGGPLLNPRGEVLGIHCGTSLDDKSYAANAQIIPYLVQAYHEGTADVPLLARQLVFGSIRIDERILYIQTENEVHHVLNSEDIYDQLPQSLIMSLYQDLEVRYVKFLLGSHLYDVPTYRVLVYDKKTKDSYFEPVQPSQRW